MTATITVQAKQLGRKRALFPDRSIPYPPTQQAPGAQMTLRDLISWIVAKEVESFRQRQDERRLIQVLTAQEISAGVEAGKIDSGERDLKQTVDEDSAIATALEAFTDGLYYVFIDGSQQTNLDSPVYVKPDSTVTFIRLVLLAGG